jgi:hypothetical protein
MATRKFNSKTLLASLKAKYAHLSDNDKIATSIYNAIMNIKEEKK